MAAAGWCETQATMSTFSVQGQRVVVVGAARSGIAAARLLVSRGARVVLTDVRASIDGGAALEGAGIVLELGGHRQETLAQSDLIVLSPGVSPSHPLLAQPRSAGIPIIGELELAWRWFQGPVVAITGTKGKSTTTTLIGRMLRAGGLHALVGGNLGPAASLQVGDTSPGAIHVVEASSFQLETIDRFRPDVAVFLNFSPDHLDRHASVEEYASAKARIFENQQPEDVAVINAEDPAVGRLAGRTRARRRPFAVGSVPAGGVGVEGDWIVAGRRGERALIPLAAVRLPGRHLLADVVAAAAVADTYGVGADAMTRAVETFGGLEHALETVARIGGVRFVNDSKATNVEASRMAIEAFESGVVAILGGRFKGGDIGTLAAPLAAHGRAVVAFGESRALFREALREVIEVIEAGSLEEAVQRAWRLAQPDGVVLLAPACASFDMFRDYAERGRAFKQEVTRLQAEAGV
jgi:UDP-N-acetylmuramoylalanine--D-glutamate ligase